MSDDYGQKMANALAAVQRMFVDVSKLFTDADGIIGKGKTSVFENLVHRGTSQAVYKPSAWIPSWVYRYYTPKENTDPRVVEAMTAWFSDEHHRISEPHFVVGQICYSLDPAKQVRGICQEWDLVAAYGEWNSPTIFGSVLSGRSPLQKPAIQWYKVIGVPLFSIGSIDDVVKLMERVREAELPPSPILGTGDASAVEG